MGHQSFATETDEKCVEKAVPTSIKLLQVDEDGSLQVQRRLLVNKRAVHGADATQRHAHVCLRLLWPPERRERHCKVVVCQRARLLSQNRGPGALEESEGLQEHAQGVAEVALDVEAQRDVIHEESRYLVVGIVHLNIRRFVR